MRPFRGFTTYSSAVVRYSGGSSPRAVFAIIAKDEPDSTLQYLYCSKKEWRLCYSEKYNYTDGGCLSLEGFRCNWFAVRSSNFKPERWLGAPYGEYLPRLRFIELDRGICMYN